MEQNFGNQHLLVFPASLLHPSFPVFLITGHYSRFADCFLFLSILLTFSMFLSIGYCLSLLQTLNQFSILLSFLLLMASWLSCCLMSQYFIIFSLSIIILSCCIFVPFISISYYSFTWILIFYQQLYCLELSRFLWLSLFCLVFWNLSSYIVKPKYSCVISFRICSPLVKYLLYFGIV